MKFTNPNYALYKLDWQPKPALEKMPRRKKHYLRRIWNWILNQFVNFIDNPLKIIDKFLNKILK